jgi:hypothetical protein
MTAHILSNFLLNDKPAVTQPELVTASVKELTQTQLPLRKEGLVFDSR